MFGFTAFVFFVLFATHVMLSLYARSTITAIAYDAARRAAEGHSEAESSQWAVARVGPRCEGTTTCFRWQSTSDNVVLVVDIPPGASLIPATLRRPMGIDHIRRTFVVRREQDFR